MQVQDETMLVFDFSDPRFGQLIRIWGGRLSIDNGHRLYFYEWLKERNIQFKTEGKEPLKVVIEISINEKKFLEILLRNG